MGGQRRIMDRVFAGVCAAVLILVVTPALLAVGLAVDQAPSSLVFFGAGVGAIIAGGGIMYYLGESAED
jgi:lipopolysaccharide/colanic/teichoic acid biosynthesis glycosyltransferase